VLQLMDHYSAGFGVLVIAIVECVAVSWIYGTKQTLLHVRAPPNRNKRSILH